MSPPSLSLIVEVKARHEEALGIATFELADPHGRPLPPFSAGAHIDVQVKEGVIRQYSLCNHSEERDRYLIGVLRDEASRGGSIAMHDEIKVGSLLLISAPKNHFPLKPAKRTYLLAGGIGITPLLCMAERLARTERNSSCTTAPAPPSTWPFVSVSTHQVSPIEHTSTWMTTLRPQPSIWKNCLVSPRLTPRSTFAALADLLTPSFPLASSAAGQRPTAHRVLCRCGNSQRRRRQFRGAHCQQRRRLYRARR